MGSFLKHPKFWLPIVVLLAIELAFRWGVWEPLAEPSSYSGTGIQVKRAAAEYGPERITAITVGDSRTRFGFLHPEILERSEAAGGAHVSLAMPGSNRATITVVTAWAMREFPNLEQVVVGVPVNTLFEENNGYYEIGNIEPFRTMADTVWLAQYLPPLKGDPDSLGILSSLMSYRRDLTSYLSDPEARHISLEWTERNGLTFSRSRKNHLTDLCEFNLDSRASCRAELRDLRKSGRGKEPVARSFANKCKGRGETSRYETKGLYPEWLAWFQRTGQDVELTVVLTPEHTLLRNRKAQRLAITALRELEAQGYFRLLDLTDVFNDNECAFYRDLVHANHDGAILMTEYLEAFLKGVPVALPMDGEGR